VLLRPLLGGAGVSSSGLRSVFCYKILLKITYFFNFFGGKLPSFFFRRCDMANLKTGRLGPVGVVAACLAALGGGFWGGSCFSLDLGFLAAFSFTLVF